MTRTKRHAVLVVLAAAAPIAATALAGPTLSGGAASVRASDRPQTAGAFLFSMELYLDQARTTDKSRKQRIAISGAARKKGAFIRSIHPETGESLRGCEPKASGRLLEVLEIIDVSLEVAARQRGPTRRGRLVHSYGAAEIASDTLVECPGADETARVIAREIQDRVLALLREHEDGKLATPELKKGIARIEALKRTLLDGQRIRDCETSRFYALAKEIDLPLELATENDDFESRQKLAREARRPAEELTELWSRTPCATPCRDEEDNDGDGVIDEEDRGCQTGPGAAYDGSDRSEQHGVSTSLDCSSLPFNTPVDVFIGNPNPGSTIIRHHLRNVTSGRLLVEKDPTMADFSLGGPDELGTGACGPGTTATAEWVRNGTTVSWHLTVTKTNSGTVPPVHHIVAAADTR